MLEFLTEEYMIIDIFVSNFWTFMSGLRFTFTLTVVVMTAGTILGVLLALGRSYGNKILSFLCTAYIELIRGTPMLAQLFILYFALPPYGINLSAAQVAYLGFTLNASAYQAEYTRGSLESVETDQFKSAYSLGMSRWQTIFYIVLPQAVRWSIPAWTNEFIYILKYTSLAYIIGAPDLMTQGKFIASRNYQFFRVYLIAAIIYLVIVTISTWLVDRLEDKIRIPGFRGEENF
ncbi:amino acid ABC transporter permease [Halarsenatibacter silvermanii]|uniref:Amino acid ABC transporter membrane protein 2, PAAT family n=1 Tax=Halarsenatibacter silvermanii TaxID=321763 RepID=A0A1G9L0Q0_9FIRM|nr:amino acid ABC transporter permease [Halarsenatibacter silvermanii]SDL55333.1 amino acid ABC transporter membrane protein 2, PAAT family [Halarsenatibacter silvermanii]